jgi:methylenetetrahydrofolate--tRNA-(uracil-5-)-methyltransferase
MREPWPESKRLCEAVKVVGGGLAGSEAAWQAAERGVNVVLYEMRPGTMTPAHVTGQLAELVCSNSLGSDQPDRASGLLKAELRRLGSMVLACADTCRVPAGGALAVDREDFADAVSDRINGHPRIRLTRREVKEIPEGPSVIASGPLTSTALAAAIAKISGEQHLYFFDAVAPIVTAGSVDLAIAFRASRYDRGGPDYLNCPMSKSEYDAFVDGLLTAERIPLRDFERGDARFFEGCLPVEVMAARGRDALAFGPLRPVGLTDPRTGGRPYAVVQLRQDNLLATAFNLVGFQTNLRHAEQRRVFRLIPGLEHAEFVRYGQMHRNTFIRSPALLDETGAMRSRPCTFFAGQITGAEGYVSCIASGWVAGVGVARWATGQPALKLPRTTMVGALCYYVSHADVEGFQPMKANFSLLPPLAGGHAGGRQARRRLLAARALDDIEDVAQATCPSLTAS